MNRWLAARWWMMALALCAACAGDDRPPVRSASDAGDAAPGDAPPGDAAPDDAADGSRFVPAPHRPFPVLSRNDGGVLDPVRLVMILGPDEPLRDALRAFADAVPASAWLRETGGPYGVRMASEVVHLVGGAVPERMNRAALRAYVAAAYARQPAAAPDGHSVYLVVFPPGTHFQADDGGEDPCSLSGEHSSLSNAPWAGETTDGLAWAHRCALSPGQTELDALTVTIGHELHRSGDRPQPPPRLRAAGRALPARRRRASLGALGVVVLSRRRGRERRPVRGRLLARARSHLPAELEPGRGGARRRSLRPRAARRLLQQHHADRVGDGPRGRHRAGRGHGLVDRPARRLVRHAGALVAVGHGLPRLLLRRRGERAGQQRPRGHPVGPRVEHPGQLRGVPPDLVGDGAAPHRHGREHLLRAADG